MTALRDISFLWSMVHIVVFFLLLFEPRFSWGKTLAASFSGAALLVVLNGLVMLWKGPEIIMSIALFSCTLPSLLLFFVLSKYRDGRFFFLFCLSDTSCFWLMQLTNFLDRMAGGTYIVLLVGRLVVFPLAEFLFWRYLRRPFRTLQRELDRGWWLFAAIGGTYYLLVMLTAVPVDTPMPDAAGLARILLVMLLMPLTYLAAFRSLWRQMQIYESRRREAEARQAGQVFSLQTRALRHQTEALQARERALMNLRHDMRHTLNSVAALVRSGQTEEACAYIRQYEAAVTATRSKRRCQNDVLNVILDYYLGMAEAEGITVTAWLNIPQEIELDTAELSAVFANAIENAVNACRAQPEGAPRWIEITAVVQPQFALEIANPYAGEVRFGPDGLPVSAEKGHGFGTRSIAAFAKKYNAYLQCKAENGVFRLRLMPGAGDSGSP